MEYYENLICDKADNPDDCERNDLFAYYLGKIALSFRKKIQLRFSAVIMLQNSQKAYMLVNICMFWIDLDLPKR